ncbi:hypothetical protein BC2926_38780 [Bacillus cereus]|nr:hypothetical protein BC2926_38780 [Bacillus cereus]
MKHIKLGEFLPGFANHKIINFEHIEGTFCNFALKIDMDGEIYSRIIHVNYHEIAKEPTLVYMEPLEGETFVDQTLIFNELYDEIKERYEELRKPYRLKDITSGTDKNIERAVLYSHLKLRCKLDYLNTFGDIPGAIEKIKEHNYNFKTFFLPVRRNYEEYVETLSVTEKTKKSYSDSLETFFNYLFKHKLDRLETFNEDDLSDFIEYKVTKEERKTTYLRKIMTSVLDYARYKQRFLDKKKIAWMENKSQPKKVVTKAKLEEIENFLYLKYEKVTERHDLLPKLSKLRDQKRNYIMFKLLLETGCEIEELLLCNVENVQTENGVNGIWIRGRFVPLRKHTFESLQKYMQFRKDKDILIEEEKWEIGIKTRRLWFKAEEISEKYADPLLVKRLEETKKEFKKKGISDTNAAKQALIDLKYSIMLNGVYRYIKETFVFNNALFVSNRYNRISKVTCMEIFRNLEITTTELREYAVQSFFDFGMELEEVVRLVGNTDGLKLDKYIVKEAKKEKQVQNIKSDLPERDI